MKECKGFMEFYILLFVECLVFEKYNILMYNILLYIECYFFYFRMILVYSLFIF